MSSAKFNKCPHLDNVLQLSLSEHSELCKSKQGSSCSECKANGPNLWICLYKTCLYVGCSEQYNDHSTKHFHNQQLHCIHMNLSSQRTWCYLCESEVFLAAAIAQKQHVQQRRNSVMSNDSSDTNSTSRYGGGSGERVIMYDRGDSCGESSCDEEDGNSMSGLVGLQNIANTCYMNSALQALSNSPPLTGYFMDCGDFVEASGEMSQNQRKLGLAKNYHKLIKEMWSKNRRTNGYLVPGGILTCIRNVHPMFRGFQQHDTQEFLRCFMDQLHEELKEVTPPPPDILFNNKNNNNNIDHDDELSSCSSPSASQSEAEYETCDSGVSEQSSLSDEGYVNRRRSGGGGYINNHYHPSSPAPSSASSLLNINQRNNSKSNSSNHMSSASSINSTQQQQQQGGSSGNGNIDGGSSGSNMTDKKKLPHRSIISDVFDGKLLSSVQCLTCDRISTREETFQDLSLPIPNKDHLAVLHQNHGMNVQIAQQHHQQHQQQHGASGGSGNGGSGGVTCSDAVYQASQDGWLWWLLNWFRSWLWGPAVSLHDCMAAFFSADELKGDNMYSCEKCNKLRNGIKYSRVLALPEMLCVHLKRFRHDLSYSSKISSPVHFPLVGLDMKPYLHRDCKSEIFTYDLTAVICHHGTVGGGHYTCYAKHEPSKKWFEYDDQLVTEVSPDTVENCEAYVLFYRKINHQMALLRSEALRLADTTLHQASDIRFFVSRQWLNRLNTFAEPGPIDNWALLCPHGGLPPFKAAHVNRLVYPLPQALWDFLYNKFGGGPACNHLFECDTCRQAAESLSTRQNNELMAFAAYHDEFQLQDNPSTIYAISMAWFRQWQLFAHGRTSDEPGPINNAGIAAQSDSIPIRSVRPGSDYAQINTTLWRFFHGIYGGGPEIILRGGEDKITRTTEREVVDPIELTEEVVTNQPVSTTTGPKSKSIHSMPTTSVSSPQPEPASKVTKNVSFEINDTEMDGNSEVTTTSTESTLTTNSSSVKRSKKENNFTTGTETVPIIGGKKDKKYRAMKSIGFFGPEGRYIEHSNNTNNNNINSNTNINTSNEEDKKIDEIMPLLNQTTISNNISHQHDGNEQCDAEKNIPLTNGPTSTVITATISNKNPRRDHKTNHRKKLKTKSGRKMINNHHHHHHNNDSDSA